jgi:ABC-type transport system involved in cytochrome c biogenesis permease subunit
MRLAPLPCHDQSPTLPVVFRWLMVASVCLGFIAAMTRANASGMIAESSLQTSLSLTLISYANLLLIAATILYVLHLWFRAHAVGLWATSLSAVGALGLVSGLLVRGTESYFKHSTESMSLNSLSEVMSLFSAITVIIYLVMEWVYRTRSAGAFVMPIVAVAIIFEAFGGANHHITVENKLSIYRSYWVHAHLLSNVIAYCAFALAATMGVIYLRRQRKQGSPPGTATLTPPQLNLPQIENLMHQAISFGFLLLSLSTILSMYLMNETLNTTWERFWVWYPKENSTLIVWSSYATYFYLRHFRKWHGARMAYWAISAFCFAAFVFLISNYVLPHYTPTNKLTWQRE